MDQPFINWAGQQLNSHITVSTELPGNRTSVYYLVSAKGNFFLKIGSSLKNESERLHWLSGRLPVPRWIDFTRIGERDALLVSAIEGINLAKLSKHWSADRVVDKLVEALHLFHASEIKDCPFGEAKSGQVLVHGDACLPNFIFKGDALAGFVDLGDVKIADPEIDLSAAIWSLQHNVGPGYGMRFLRKYGVEHPAEEYVEQLRLNWAQGLL